MKTMRAVGALAVAIGLAACDGPTGADGDAQMQVAVRGDDAPAAQSSAPSGASYSHTSAAGTIDFRARVYARTSSGAWVTLTEAAQGTVDASGHAAAQTVATARVRADGYTRVRVVFERVEAQMSGGLHLSTGLLTGTVSVQAQSGGTIVVERDVSMSASAGATTRLLVNLNADAWLSQANAQTRTVSEAAFRSAVRVAAE